MNDVKIVLPKSFSKFVSVCIGDLKYNEVGDVIGISPAHIKALHRGIAENTTTEIIEKLAKFGIERGIKVSSTFLLNKNSRAVFQLESDDNDTEDCIGAENLIDRMEI